MSEEHQVEDEASDAEPQAPVAPAAAIPRRPASLTGLIVSLTAFAWSLFQVWHASPLPLALGIGLLNDTAARSIHLAFAMFLAFTVFPAWGRAARDRIPDQDWAFAVLGAVSAAYLYLFYDALSLRPGTPNTVDLVAAAVGLVLLLEATRRAIGLLPMFVALAFLIYSFSGFTIPEAVVREGATPTAAVALHWLSAEGVFGTALGVSTDFVFPLVLFSALFYKAGSVDYLTRVALSLLGQLRGGAIGAAAVSTAVTGLIAGSSVTNVATTGATATSLMKRAGLPADKAGAVAVAASAQGQLMPPLMGLAAFLIMDRLGISYLELIEHAFLPALITFVALLALIHLDARKAGVEALSHRNPRFLAHTVFVSMLTIVGLAVLSGGAYYGMAWIEADYGDHAELLVLTVLVTTYLALLGIASFNPDPAAAAPEVGGLELPDPGPTIRSGLYHLLPVAVLVWCFAVERLSPARAAFWATVAVTAIIITQRPLLAVMRRSGELAGESLAGLVDLFDGLAAGARQMAGIGVASAAAGIILGTAALTDLGVVMTDVAAWATGGNLALTLVAAVVVSVVLAMGMPTAAGYLVLAALVVPMLVTLGTHAGLALPLVAAHIFVFYIVVLLDGVPLVGRAALAAAEVARSGRFKTGLQADAYDLGAVVLPFVFIFNTQLLMIGIDNRAILVLTIAGAVIAALAFAAAVQGFFLVRNRVWETAALLLVAFSLVHPGFWWDMLHPPTRFLVTTYVPELAERMPAGSRLRLRVEGAARDGQQVDTIVALPMGPATDGSARLREAGIEIRVDEGTVFIDNLVFGSPADRAGLDVDWRITGVEVASERPPKQTVFLPAVVLYGLIWLVQYRRRRGGRKPPKTRIPPRLTRGVET